MSGFAPRRPPRAYQESPPVGPVCRTTDCPVKPRTPPHHVCRQVDCGRIPVIVDVIREITRPCALRPAAGSSTESLTRKLGHADHRILSPSRAAREKTRKARGGNPMMRAGAGRDTPGADPAEAAHGADGRPAASSATTSPSSTQSAGRDRRSASNRCILSPRFDSMRPFTGVGDRAEAVVLELEGPFGPAEGFAPGDRGGRGDGHMVLIPRNSPARQLAVRPLAPALPKVYSQEPVWPKSKEPLLDTAHSWGHRVRADARLLQRARLLARRNRHFRRTRPARHPRNRHCF